MSRVRIIGWVLAAAGLAGLIFRVSRNDWFGLDGATLVMVASIVLALGAGIVLGGFGRNQLIASSWQIRWRIARATALALTLMLLMMTIVVYVRGPPLDGHSEFISLAFVALLSGAVGFAELTERYRDNPARLFAADPTIIYIAVNVAAAAAALALIQEFEVFGANQKHRDVYEVLLASFGSIAFFRSSLFTARVGDKDVDVGPSTLLKSLLETSDRMINRSQARDRVDDTAAIMRQVDFAKAKATLPAFCFTVVENVTREEQEGMAAAIIKLGSQADMTDRQRSIILGSYLMRIVGPMVLARAVNALGDTITIAT